MTLLPAALSQEGMNDAGDAVYKVGRCSAESEHAAIDSTAALIVLSKAPQGEAVVEKRLSDNADFVDVDRQGEGEVQASGDASDVGSVDG